jgi:hypothetical protein
MKREFLQGLSVAGAPLSKEVIDAIMAENGRDIENAKGDTQALQALLAEKETWEASLRAEKERHEKELGEMQFSHTLENAIRQARGRNQKAITALLELDTLRGNPEATFDAVEKLREEAPYLFESKQTPPVFSHRTGGQTVRQEDGPATLAGALKERMNYERK